MFVRARPWSVESGSTNTNRQAPVQPLSALRFRVTENTESVRQDPPAENAAASAEIARPGRIRSCLPDGEISTAKYFFSSLPPRIRTEEIEGSSTNRWSYAEQTEP